MELDRALPGWLAPSLGVLSFALVTWVETLRPLRAVRHGKPRRILRNVATGALAAVPAGLQGLLLAPVLVWVDRERIGLLHAFEIAPWLQVALGFLLLDATLWIWHWLNHAVPFLWRFHLVHHVDQDLDSSTALRFHFGEMALSVPWRLGQVVLIGSSPLALSVWGTALLVSILFHHGNAQLPLRFERALVRIVVTPRMHGIHHSTVRAERNTNYSSLLTVWDWLFGTLLLSVPQQRVRIGVPPFDEADERRVSFGCITALPFRDEASSGLRDAQGPPRMQSRASRLAE